MSRSDVFDSMTVGSLVMKPSIFSHAGILFSYYDFRRKHDICRLGHFLWIGIIVAALLLFSALSNAAPLGDCSAETSLDGRSDVVFCEPWEDSNWWQNGYLRVPRVVDPLPAIAEDVSRVSVVSDNCVSGNCLKVDMPQFVSGSLNLSWPLSDAGLEPEQLYLRYYIKLGPDFDPNQCRSDGSYAGQGGKFPGLADRRTSTDSFGNCGNGGELGDGINCWTMRADFLNCNSGDGNACSTKPNATMRFGSYLYFYDQRTSTGSHGLWDSDDWYQSGGGSCATTPNDVYCGLGDGGVFENDRWYLVEMFVKMNTPDIADGVIRGWVDGTLSYEKTNMIWRLSGHDNLHVRHVWLDVYKGGVNGNCVASEIYLDQMVLSTDQMVGPINVVRPSAPTNLRSD